MTGCQRGLNDEEKDIFKDRYGHPGTQVAGVEFMCGFKMVAMMAVHALTHPLTNAYVLVSNLSNRSILATVHSR